MGDGKDEQEDVICPHDNVTMINQWMDGNKMASN